MMDPKSPLHDIASTVTAAEDDALQARPMPALRSAPVEDVSRSLFRRRAAVALAVAAAICVVIASSRLMRARPLSVDVGGVASTDVGAWMSTEQGAERPVRFSDGSTLLLEGATRARVTSTSARGAHVQIERGRVVASVVHADGTSWLVDAGPFTVRVTGTRFVVGWDASTETFSLDLLEGSVVVRGPETSDTVLVAGQSFRRALRAPALPLTAEADASTPPSTDVDAGVPPRPAPSSPVPSAPAVPWHSLAEAGRYTEAMKTVHAEGVDRVLESASATRLLDLAEAARFAHDGNVETRSLRALRRRFPRTDAAAQAAFMLGRIAFDAEHSPREAVRWFETYLDEAPSGLFAREALGRLVEAHDRAGDGAEAAWRAEQYLARFPSGPHAALARSLLRR